MTAARSPDMTNCGGDRSASEEPILESIGTRTGTEPEVANSLHDWCWLLLAIIGLLFQIAKGLIILPITAIIIGIGNTAVILALWPVHIIWTSYSILRTRLLGPVLKTAGFVGVVFLLLIWPVPSILGSFLYGACYGFLQPCVSTCGSAETSIVDFIFGGTWSTITGSFSIVKKFSLMCFGSYFSTMEKYINLEPPDGVPYEIRLFLLVGAISMGVIGIIVDVPMVTIMAIYKSLLGIVLAWALPFTHETCWNFIKCICGIIILSIFFCPVAVVAVAASFLYGFFLGGYAAIITYEESSILMGLRYIVASLAKFDEFMLTGEESCFPKLSYRYNEEQQLGYGPHPIDRENIITIM